MLLVNKNHGALAIQRIVLEVLLCLMVRTAWKEDSAVLENAFHIARLKDCRVACVTSVSGSVSY